jgi:hypothetical protein
LDLLICHVISKVVTIFLPCVGLPTQICMDADHRLLSITTYISDAVLPLVLKLMQEA